MLNLFTRAVRRAGIPIRYSLGFHPHPKFSFATALSVGIESTAEYFDMEIAVGYGAERVKERLNAALPDGMEILDAVEIPLRSASLSTIMDKVRYRVGLPVGLIRNLPVLVENFLALESCPYRREKQSKTVEIDLRRELFELHATDAVLEMVIGRGKPLEFVTAVTGLSEPELHGVKIEKLEVIFKPERAGEPVDAGAGETPFCDVVRDPASLCM
jgi:radical SAM-linked protein